MLRISEQAHAKVTVAVGLNSRPRYMSKRQCRSVPSAPQPQPGLIIAVNSSWGRLDVLPLVVLEMCVADVDDFLGQYGWGSCSRLNVASKELYEWTMSSILVVFPPPGPLGTPLVRGWGQAVSYPEWNWVHRGCCIARTDELDDWRADPRMRSQPFPWAHKTGTPRNSERWCWGPYTYWGPHRLGLPWY